MTHMAPDDDTIVLIVEDDEIMRLSLEDRLRIERIPVIAVPNLTEARRVLRERHVDMIVTDVRLPDGSGHDLFQEVVAAQPGVPVMLMTGYGSVREAVDLVKAGAVDYLTKPFRMDAFIRHLRSVLATLSDREVALRLPGQEQEVFRPGTGHLGRSAAMRRIERLASRVAPLDSSILITGESGVGKEVVANLLHYSSNRASGPFVKVNCAAIPLTLVESALFGHEKGAFTGADKRQIGRFEQAQKGTIFLDEIAEVPPEVQVKLLRVLQERVVERVGGRESIPLDVRVIAATQVDLTKATADGRFRSDLYWRLNVINIDVPPLRERPEDIVFLARKFSALHAVQMGRAVHGLSPDAEAYLAEQSFPGNVRELKNLLERAVALCDGHRLELRDLRPLDEDDVDHPATLREVVERAERDGILRSLEANDWVIQRAADTLGISRKNLWEKMRRYDIRRAER